MKATGIIRRVDDLGRIVIPKEIRRQMSIKDGDPMEIYVDGKSVCFKKYNPIDTDQYETAERILKRIMTHEFWVLADHDDTVIVAGCDQAEKEFLKEQVYTKIHIYDNQGEEVAGLYIRNVVSKPDDEIVAAALEGVFAEGV